MNRYQKIEQRLEVYRNRLPEPDNDLPPRIVRLIRFTQAHLFHPQVTNGWMKKQCHVNGKSFSGKFAFYTGFTPKQYILHHRMEAAKMALKQTEASVTQTAFAVGFNSLSAFCKTFKNKIGLRPSQWRKQHA